MLIPKSCELHKVLGDHQSFSFPLFPLLFIHPALSNGWRCFYREVEAAQGCEINHHWPDHLIPLRRSSLFNNVITSEPQINGEPLSLMSWPALGNLGKCARRELRLHVAAGGAGINPI